MRLLRVGVWTQRLSSVSRGMSKMKDLSLTRFSAQRTECCSFDAEAPVHPPAAQLSCFMMAKNPNAGHCLDPVLILSPDRSKDSKVYSRCYSRSDCASEAGGLPMECVVPHPRAELLRLTVESPLWEVKTESRVVLWSGPKDEVWEEG